MPACHSLLAHFTGIFRPATYDHVTTTRPPFFFFVLDEESRDALEAARTIPSLANLAELHRSLRFEDGLAILVEEHGETMYLVPFQYGVIYIALQSYIWQVDAPPVKVDELEAHCRLARMFLSALSAASDNMTPEWSHPALAIWFTLVRRGLPFTHEHVFTVSEWRNTEVYEAAGDAHAVLLRVLTPGHEPKPLFDASVFQCDFGERRSVRVARARSSCAEQQ
jgi:hypothetical protein